MITFFVKYFQDNMLETYLKKTYAKVWFSLESIGISIKSFKV